MASSIFSKFKLPHTSEKGFTLIELLVVMVVIFIIAILGVSGFSAMRRLQNLNQTVLSLQSTFSNLQREAILFNRSLGEYWVHGIVLEIENDGNEIILTTYKYCDSQTEVKIDYPQTPELPPISQDSGLNNNTCDGDVELLPIAEEKITNGRIDYDFVARTSGEELKYISVQTLTGQIYLYDSSGGIIRYNGNPRLAKGDLIIDTGSFTGKTFEVDGEINRIQLRREQN